MNRGLAAGIAAATLALVAGSASAGISSSIVHIEATSALGTGSIDIINNSDFNNGILFTNLTESVDITNDNGDVIATLVGLNVLLIADPVVNMNFAVFAGAADTHFTLTSTLLSFPGMLDPDARASASVSVTDSNGDGAVATGGYAGGKVFRSFYNGAVAGAGTVFSSLVDSPVAVPDGFGSEKASEESGPGFEVIPGLVDSMSTEFDFTVSAFDQLAGTSTFVIVPTPASVALASIGGLAMLRRKR
ncbi:MAG: hypothetical protein IT435_08535 [Phycisphaerales bacterium]|nr:hypothetical protein [Phycisphaerales bacterium]